MSMHWLGGHEDVQESVEELNAVLDSIYLRMFREMRDSAGVEFPIVLHKLDYPDRAMECDSSGRALKSMYFISGTFMYLSKICKNVYTFDNTKAPHYICNIRGNGLYLDVDAVHHTEQTNRWIAQSIFEHYRKKLSENI